MHVEDLNELLTLDNFKPLMTTPDGSTKPIMIVTTPDQSTYN